MSLLDEKNKVFDKLLLEYEQEFGQFSKELKRDLYRFIQTGPHTKADVLAFFEGTNFTATVNGFVDRYDDVLAYTKRVAKESGIPLVLPERSTSILALYKENQIESILSNQESIIRTVTDASLRYGIGESKIDTIIKEIEGEINTVGRRIITEAHTGASMYDRYVKYEQFNNAKVDLYFYDGPVDSKTRDACMATLNDPRQETGWTMAEIASSETPFITCGGYNCRHEWLPYVENLDAEIERMYGETAGVRVEGVQ